MIHVLTSIYVSIHVCNMCVYIYKLNFMHKLNIYLHYLILSLSYDNFYPSNVLLVGYKVPFNYISPLYHVM